MVAGAKWLLANQQANGGWGESPNSYERPNFAARGRPPPRRRPGPCSAWWPPAWPITRPCSAASATLRRRKTTTAPGRKANSPAQASPVSFISVTITTPFTSP